MFAAQRFEPRVRALVRRNIGGIDRQRPVLEIAQTHVVPSARGNTSGVRISPFASWYSRNSASAGIALAGLEHQAVALVAIHRRQRQPARGQDRPRSHGDHDRIAFDDLAAVEHDAVARRRSARAPGRRPCPAAAPRPAPRRRASNRVVKARGSTSAVVCGEPSWPVIVTLSLKPRPPGARAPRSFSTAVAGIGRRAPIAPRIAERVGEFGVKREAAPRQPIERVPRHQSSARKPPDLPEAAPPTSLRSMTIGSAPRRLRK